MSVRSRVAGTAVGPMVVLAVEQEEPRPLVCDEVAARMASTPVRALIRATKWGPVRRWVVGASEKQMPGLWAGLLCRKRYVQDAVSAAVRDRAAAVVMLGAGMDTLAYRASRPAGVPVFEVDMPVNVARKRAHLHRLYGRVPAHVRLVPVDFATDDLAAALAANGHRTDAPTFYVWEAVTQYLTEDVVRATLDALPAAPGSRLVFTYIRRDFLDGRNLYGAGRLHRRFAGRDPLWRFGLDPADVPAFLAEHGWRQIEQLGPAEFTARYLRPASRDLSVSEIERSALAEKP